MTTYNFDREIERKKTNSLKYDFAVERGRDVDVLPLWVADMDFQAPKPVLDALQNAVSHGIFGYSEVKGEYFNALYRWFDSRFDWQPKSEWLVKTPGVVFALAMAVRALTKEGDSVLIQPPVYYPFFEGIRDNNRKIVESPLLLADGHYEIDFDDLEEKIASQNVKLFLLCSPHNPVGRVWTKEELQKLGELCDRYHVFVVSDEIHCDFAFPEHPHTIFAKACPQLEEKMILCTAPSKTFNLAGLQVSNIWVPGKEVRDRFKAEINAAGYSQLNALGLIACQAAYENGGEWLTLHGWTARDWDCRTQRWKISLHIRQSSGWMAALSLTKSRDSLNASYWRVRKKRFCRRSHSWKQPAGEEIHNAKTTAGRRCFYSMKSLC